MVSKEFLPPGEGAAADDNRAAVPLSGGLEDHLYDIIPVLHGLAHFGAHLLRRKPMLDEARERAIDRRLGGPCRVLGPPALSLAEFGA